MTRAIFDSLIGTFKSKHNGILPGIVIIHPQDYIQLMRSILEVSSYGTIKFYDSFSAPIGEPVFAISGQQLFVPLNHPHHEEHRRNYNLTSTVYIKFKPLPQKASKGVFKSKPKEE